MPTINSNQLSFATLTQSYDNVRITGGTTANTYTFITSGSTEGSVITDVLFKSADASIRNFNIIICPVGQQTTAQYNIVQISVAASAGSNGSTSIGSLTTAAPLIFDVDLAGNRIITLEAGMSIYVQNTATLTGDFIVMAKRRNF